MDLETQNRIEEHLSQIDAVLDLFNEYFGRNEGHPFDLENESFSQFVVMATNNLAAVRKMVEDLGERRVQP